MEPFTLMHVNQIEPVKTRKIKFTLFLILAVSVTALVLLPAKLARIVFADKVCVLLS